MLIIINGKKLSKLLTILLLEISYIESIEIKAVNLYLISL